MIDIKSKMCKECNNVRSIEKYKGYCLRCFIFLFPGVKVSRNYKVKEQHVIDFIKDIFKDKVFTFNKTVGGCSARIPDAYIDLFTHVLIIECDENQHKNYEQICDNKRTMLLFEDFNNRPIVFIRFNPDTYINENGYKVLSSFKYHKTSGIPMIRNKKEWENRLNVLKKNIEKWFNNIPEKEITKEYLFYDENKQA